MGGIPSGNTYAHLAAYGPSSTFFDSKVTHNAVTEYKPRFILCIKIIGKVFIKQEQMKKQQKNKPWYSLKPI